MQRLKALCITSYFSYFDVKPFLSLSLCIPYSVQHHLYKRKQCLLSICLTPLVTQIGDKYTTKHKHKHEL